MNGLYYQDTSYGDPFSQSSADTPSSSSSQIYQPIHPMFTQKPVPKSQKPPPKKAPNSLIKGSKVSQEDDEMTQADESFVDAVREVPCLWQRSDPNYKNQGIKDGNWELLQQKFGHYCKFPGKQVHIFIIDISCSVN